jgi:hypothetical protein
MVSKVSRYFLKQFRRRVKMEREIENGLTQEDLKLKCFLLYKNIHSLL